MSDNNVVCDNCHRIYDSSREAVCPECCCKESTPIALKNNEPKIAYKDVEELIPLVLEKEPVKWFQCKKPEETQHPVEDEKSSTTCHTHSSIPDQKHDEGKPAVGQMKKDFPRALMMLAKLTSYGIKQGKAAGEWKNIPNAEVRFEDAHGRHDLLMHTEFRDSESMFPHAAHRAWDAMAVLELILMEEEGDE